MVDGPPEIVHFAIDPHGNLVQMPAPLRVSPLLCGTRFLDLRCERRAEPIPPSPHCLVADIDPSFVEQVFDLLLARAEIEYTSSPQGG